jgi:Asp-tRNA(Asn)/Glu-tRNA(Gln) amidotransferase A subunit family amidase
MNAADLCFTPATELARLIRAREVSPVEIADAVLARIERLNPRLNAFMTVTADLAREQAKAAEARALRGEQVGPLDGIPFTIKDLEPTAGIRTTYGSMWTKDYVPAEDGAVAGRLRQTGGVLLGKTNTPHLGYKDMCDNFIGPPGRNPWNLERTPGGSSGGAAAAIAAGLGPFGHGSDGAGSIRIPASLCGIFGFKPSYGRVPYYPSPDFFTARSHHGPMARTVRDAALLLGAMAGVDRRDPLSLDMPVPDYVALCDGDLRGLRVAWSADFGYAAVDPEVKTIAAAAARRFADLGCTVEERDPGWPNPADDARVLWNVSFGARLIERAAEHPEWIEPTMMRMLVHAGQISAIQHAKASAARTVFYDRARRFFDEYDLLLTPQEATIAWSVASGPNEGPGMIDGRSVHDIFDRQPFTFPFNMTHQPAATVPCGFTKEGLPVGLQIVGRWHQDELVLRAAACFEALQPWGLNRPPLDD